MAEETVGPRRTPKEEVHPAEWEKISLTQSTAVEKHGVQEKGGGGTKW